MKKVVINSCFGGFSFSATAVARIAELQGKKAYFFEMGYGGEPRKLTIGEANETFATAFYTPEPPISTPDLLALSPEERAKWIADYKAVHFSITGRDDPFLVQAVEELGEKANTKISDLKIVEIPDDVEWEIQEYDGSEWVAEKHRVWR